VIHCRFPVLSMTSSFLKPYQTLPIQDNGDPLIPIPPDPLRLLTPHPYESLGAPYGDRSPFYLRSEVVDRLLQAQLHLETMPRPDHLQGQALYLQIFDAYRPVAVQQFMVDYTFEELVREQGLNRETLTPQQRQDIQDQVHQFWAVPSPDPALPPPHSTGGAVDLTIVTAEGLPLDMGSPIDECSPRSYPDHFATADTPTEVFYHQNRLLLRQVMTTAGFANHPKEWWHFSYGDQLWAWLREQAEQPSPPKSRTVAYYGGV
jgi:D-alanyl-D-alanine dipeptidase